MGYREEAGPGLGKPLGSLLLRVGILARWCRVGRRWRNRSQALGCADRHAAGHLGGPCLHRGVTQLQPGRREIGCRNTGVLDDRADHQRDSCSRAKSSANCGFGTFPRSAKRWLFDGRSTARASPFPGTESSWPPPGAITSRAPAAEKPVCGRWGPGATSSPWRDTARGGHLRGVLLGRQAAGDGGGRRRRSALGHHDMAGTAGARVARSVDQRPELVLRCKHLGRFERQRRGARVACRGPSGCVAILEGRRLPNVDHFDASSTRRTARPMSGRGWRRTTPRRSRQNPTSP